MENNALKVYRKLKQLKIRFELQMSSMTPPKQLEMRPPRSKQVTDRELDSGFQVENKNPSELEEDFSKDSKYEYLSEAPKSLDNLLQEFLPQIKLSFEKWGESFGECESSENLYPTRMDEIIREAKCLENQLMVQKETLKERLMFITKTLASPLNEDE